MTATSPLDQLRASSELVIETAELETALIIGKTSLAPSVRYPEKEVL